MCFLHSWLTLSLLAVLMYSLTVNYSAKFRDSCTNTFSLSSSVSSFFLSEVKPPSRWKVNFLSWEGLHKDVLFLTAKPLHLYRAFFVLKIKDSLFFFYRLWSAPYLSVLTVAGPTPKKTRKMTERGHKRGGESADAQWELDRGLNWSLVQEGGNRVGRGWEEEEGRVNGGKRGVSWVIHGIYEGLRQGRWELRQA